MLEDRESFGEIGNWELGIENGGAIAEGKRSSAKLIPKGSL
jgi:hypothetical protein